MNVIAGDAHACRALHDRHRATVIPLSKVGRQRARRRLLLDQQTNSLNPAAAG